jgi:cytochrome c
MRKLRKNIAPILGFIALCMMAVGGGNVLRQKMFPDEYVSRNEFLEGVGKFIKGALRDNSYLTLDIKNLQMVEYGSQVYIAQCAGCHGAKLQGQANWKIRNLDGTFPAPPHDATGHTWHHSDQFLFNYIKKGGQDLMSDGNKSGMPAFGNVLNNNDIWAVLVYIKSQWSPKIQARKAKKNPK